MKQHYDKRHGGPFDRGAADAYYRRPFNPHYFVGPTYASERKFIRFDDDENFDAYRSGFISILNQNAFKHKSDLDQPKASE